MRGDVTTGTIVDGRYEIKERLGSGGMAAVYRAHDQQLGREVALKLLYPRFAEDDSFVERFRREASAAAGLQHPNVVSVYDRGEWDGTSYIAMELVTGRTLRELVQETGPMDPVRAIDCTIGVLRAARFAHRRGIVHRDLKPHNVLVDSEGRAKVTDFGIAKAGASDMTETGSIMGTAQYMSPEQAQGLAVTPRADLYAVGVLLYELLVGRPPFDGETAVSIALKQVSELPVPPGRIIPTVPPELDAVVLRALEKDPALRFADAEEFIAALEDVRAFITGDGTGGFVARNGAGGIPVRQAPPPPRRRRRWPWLVLLAVLVAGGAYAAVQLASSGEQRAVPSVVGREVTAATQRLREAGFEVRAVRRRSSRQPRDRVVSQRPGAGKTAETGSTVEITVSDGQGIDQVPQVAGLRRSEARKRLTDAGFGIDESKRSSTTIDENRAISTDPPAGSQVEGGQTVKLVISTGPPVVTVPSVVGQNRREATATLEDARFEVEEVARDDDTLDPGTVIAQEPGGDGRARRGSTVTIIVARRPPRVAVPSVGGSSLADATAQLHGLGLKVSSEDQPVTDPSQDGTVIGQDPPPGTEVQRGARVRLTVGRFDAGPDTRPGDTTTQVPPDGGAPTPGGQGQGQGTGQRQPVRRDLPVRVAVLAGGRSSEHDVSLASGESVRDGLAEAGHEVLHVLLERDGRWMHDGIELDLRAAGGLLDADVVFPVLHGPFGEDGTVQGLLELLDVAYVGSGVLASALCMDKILAKDVMAAAGLPQVRYVGVDEAAFRAERDAALAAIATLGLPVFVKPARLGSSVGIAKVDEGQDIWAALERAFAHDPRVIVEAHSPGLEIECSVLGHTATAEASTPGEIVLHGADWYDYEAKYQPGGMELRVPPEISGAAVARVREIATEAFRLSGCSGLARVDFFVEGDDVRLNEVNTMPGFTATSVYAKLWDASGVPYPQLVDRLCALAVERHELERRHRF